MNLSEEGSTRIHDSLVGGGWQARLELEFARRGERTILATRRHRGPLVIQKTFHPEGEAVCHGIVLHPPAGIAGGDELTLEVKVGNHASALLTTPGAGKLYRSGGAQAILGFAFSIEDEATLEWLPQETIVFDGAQASAETRIVLGKGSRYIGWDVLCLGRAAAGERFTSGCLRLATRIFSGRELLWVERGQLRGGAAMLDAAPGLAGEPVCGIMLATGPQIDAALLTRLREPQPATGTAGVTALPSLVVARYLGGSAEAARAYFIDIWRILRPALLKREAVLPRIWST